MTYDDKMITKTEEKKWTLNWTLEQMDENESVDLHEKQFYSHLECKTYLSILFALQGIDKLAFKLLGPTIKKRK